MQLLFTLGRDSELTFKDIEKKYWKCVEDAYALYLFNLFALIEISKASIKDTEKRHSKHLPTDFDTNFSDKLFSNDLIQDLVENKYLTKEVKKHNFQELIDQDIIEKIYYQFTKTDEYKKYQEKKSDEDHLEILLELFRFCRQSEMYNEMMEDNYPAWLDDKSLIVGSIKKSFKSLPNKDEKFVVEYYPDDETCKEFGECLLKDTHKRDSELLEHIKPTLENWDHERLAILDMILLKMAICELTTFISIPPKVSINEYVEVAKKYSTTKSKDFINGILDKLLRELTEQGMITKEGRGLVE